MCGRFVVLTREEIEDVVAAVESRDRDAFGRLELAGRAQAFPGSTVPLFGRGEQGGGLQIAEATWGFRAEWSKNPVFNTRIESAMAGAALWREAVRDGRCVVPAAAFFEPHATETVRSPKTGRPVKRAYRFADPDGAPLLLAGVQAGGHCSVLTCEPNRWVAPVHPRMPLVLRFEEVEAWLGPDWPSLADRNDVALTVAPEVPDDPVPEHIQLSLF